MYKNSRIKNNRIKILISSTVSCQAPMTLSLVFTGNYISLCTTRCEAGLISCPDAGPKLALRGS